VREGTPDLLKAILQVLEEGRAAVLATIIHRSGGLPCEIGNKALFTADGEGWGELGWPPLQAAVAKEASKALAERQTRTVSLAFSDAEAQQGGLATGGAAEIFLEVFLPNPTLLIAGAGHIAVPLAKMGKLLDFDVVVLDDRASFANKERFPEADQVIAAGFEATLKNFPITPTTYIVLVTRGHQHDVECLRVVLDSPAAYIGMIGSRRRVWAVFKLLHDEGLPTEKLRRIHAPIGLDLGAETPAEIATSIISEVVKVRRGGGVESISDQLRQRYISLLERGENLEPEPPEKAQGRLPSGGFSEDRL
jgi:xanthine dehydrogenase accessory factor